MNSVVIDGNTLACERSGSGPPLVLIHGLGGPAMWERSSPILADRFDIILPHLPGFGESPAPARPLSARDHAGILAHFLGALSLPPAAVAGISWGGEIAAHLAAARPGAVRSLVLICPTGTLRYPAPLRSRAVRQVLRPLLRRGLVNRRIADAISRRSVHDPGTRPDDLVARHLDRLRLPGHLDALLSAIDHVWSGDCPLPSLVSGLPHPLTLVWGAEDRTVPLSSAGPLRAARPDAEFVVLPLAGHSVPLERPVELAGVIARGASRTTRFS